MNQQQYAKITNLYPKQLKAEIEKDLKKKMYQGWVYLPAVLKPRPKWFPFQLWVFLMGLFIKIGKTANGQNVNIQVPNK